MTTSYLKSLSDPTNRLQKADRESVPQSILNLNPLRRLSAPIREIIPGARAPHDSAEIGAISASS